MDWKYESMHRIANSHFTDAKFQLVQPNVPKYTSNETPSINEHILPKMARKRISMQHPFQNILLRQNDENDQSYLKKSAAMREKYQEKAGNL